MGTVPIFCNYNGGAMEIRPLLAAVLLVPLGAFAQANPHAVRASPWAELADYTLAVKTPEGATGTWKYRAFADASDLALELDTPGPKGRTKGSMLLVGGEAIATHGFEPEKGFEIDPLDVAVLNLKILTQLLDAAMPRGPSSVTAKHAVQHRNDKVPLVVSTPTSNAQFGAPWSLKGTVRRVDAQTVAFDLEVQAAGATKGERARWSFAGTAAGVAKDRKLDDATSLAGWSAWRFGPDGKKGSHAGLKFAATRLDGPIATVRDLRAKLQ